MLIQPENTASHVQQFCQALGLDPEQHFTLQRETIDKMVERLEDFDDVQTVYTNMKPEPIEE